MMMMMLLMQVWLMVMWVAVEMKLRESSQMLVGQRLESHSNDRSWRVPV